MPPSKYTQAKEALLRENKKELLKDISEEQLEAFLTGVQDGALSQKLRTNWKRATAICHARPKKEKNPPPMEEPKILVEGLGIHLEGPTDENEKVETKFQVPSNAPEPRERLTLEDMGDAVDGLGESMVALYVQQQDQFTQLMDELRSIRVTVALSLALLLMLRFGDHVVRLLFM